MSEELKKNKIPFEIVSAGDHCDLRMSKQMDPFELMFGWQMRVVNATFGGLNGQSVGKWIVKKNTPPQRKQKWKNKQL